jgi:PemK-like, MazF-like toxin of type II toxin-antitoxin system
MEIPTPVPGLIIRYAYLWADEHDQGRDEGSKDRPAAVVVAHIDTNGRLLAIVAPVTHSPPKHPADAIEIPPATKRRLGLDGDRSWIVLTELNVFPWPGPDLRPVPGPVPGMPSGTIAYGMLPSNFFQAVRTRLAALHTSAPIRRISRTE